LNNKNITVKKSKKGDIKFIVERSFGNLDFMELYIDYVVDKIIEAEKKAAAWVSVA